MGGSIPLQGSMVRACHLSTASSARWFPLVGGSIPLQVSMVRACHWWRFYSLAGVNGSGVSLGEMSGNDIAMSGGSIPLQVVNGSSARWCVPR